MGERLGLVDLPDEVLELIGLWLDPSNYTHFRSSCKAFRNHLPEIPDVWERTKMGAPSGRFISRDSGPYYWHATLRLESRRLHLDEMILTWFPTLRPKTKIYAFDGYYGGAVVEALDYVDNAYSTIQPNAFRRTKMSMGDHRWGHVGPESSEGNVYLYVVNHRIPEQWFQISIADSDEPPAIYIFVTCPPKDVLDTPLTIRPSTDVSVHEYMRHVPRKNNEWWMACPYTTSSFIRIIQWALYKLQNLPKRQWLRDIRTSVPVVLGPCDVLTLT